ncbi:putative acetyltransferase [Shimia gijangensis]|uniref:Putative acetyltransferase n=1 Tax=Shimia gijangensis TaxID=1470563 RepID=A0A1M6BG61_9RHOB|nr:GNAT family N-acetyltransferase [Shimia gijangensis]SHI47699.1 putative acetyltransferase [Shimia gijangensis]
MSDITITPGDPRDPQATALLEQSHALMQSLFDPEDNHFLEIGALCVPSIQFFVAREDDVTLGCAAIANKGNYGEIKSLFVSPTARGKGISHLLMQALDTAARTQGLLALKLETGDKLTEAHSLYRAHGFEDCEPFGDYEANKSSIFMTKSLN